MMIAAVGFHPLGLLRDEFSGPAAVGWNSEHIVAARNGGIPACKPGRIFAICLENGDIVHQEIEQFARDHSIEAASLIIIGGADKGSKLIVGPERENEIPVSSMEVVLENVHEIAGAGTLFPDQQGNPVLHLHMACGRESSTKTGCIRRGVRVWHIMEVILFELLESKGKRLFDSETGFSLLRL
jgi:predicted DNA-binding protein with PD1-like motif